METLLILIAAVSGVPPGQVRINVPDVVAGARPAVVEHIKVHGQALEGNLEGDAVDREALVFLPPGYRQQPAPRGRRPAAGRARQMGGQRAACVSRSVRAGPAEVSRDRDRCRRPDGLRADAGKLHDALTNDGIANDFEIDPGTHTRDVAVRVQEHVLPVVSRTLSFEPAKR